MTPATLRASQFYPKADTPIPDAELRGLSQAGDLVDEQTAIRILERADITPKEVRRLATGTFHELFELTSSDDTRTVLKVTRLHPADDGLETEMTVTRLLADSGIPVPAIFRHGSDGERHWSLSEFASGSSLRTMDTDEDAVLAALPALARYLLSVHAIEVSGWGLLAASEGRGTQLTWSDYLGTRLDDHLARLLDESTIDRATVAEIRDVMARASNLVPDGPRLLHGDVGPHNTILGDELRLIDWEDSLGGDPAFEVAMWATFNPERRWPTFFDAYYASGWQPDFRFWAYFLRISVAKAVVRERFGYRDVPGRSPAAARIPRALAAIAELTNPGK